MRQGSHLVAAAAAVALILGFATSSATAADTPVEGPWSTRSAGMSTPDVRFWVDNLGGGVTIGSFVGRKTKCVNHFERSRVWVPRGPMRVRNGTFRGRLSNGMFHARTGKLVMGEAFEVRGKIVSARLITGRMRLQAVGKRPCDSGWIRFRVVPAEPFALSLTAPDFAVPGETRVVATVANLNPVDAPATSARVVMEHHGRGSATAPALVSATPSQGRCGPLSWMGDQAFVECDLGTVRASSSATITVVEQWSLATCSGRSAYAAGGASATYEVQRRSPLGLYGTSWDMDGDKTEAMPAGTCPPPAG